MVSSLSTHYEHGTQIQLTALPEIGWGFSHWEGDLEGTTNPATILVDSEKSVTAVFVKQEYALNIAVQGEGTVSIDPDQHIYHYGDAVTLEAIPAEGWRFDRWDGDVSLNNNPASITIEDNLDITAVFIFQIQAAIDAAQDGDTIVVPRGTYYENLNFRGKSITLKSENPEDLGVVESTIIDGGGRDSVIRIENGEANAIVMGLTLTNGSGRTIEGKSYGGGIYVSNSVATLNNNIISSNRAVYGGGIYIGGASAVNVTQNKVLDNITEWYVYGNYGGGIYLDGGSHAFTENTIEGNTTTNGAGGGVYIRNGSHIITDNIIMNNKTNTALDAHGGGMYIVFGSHNISNNAISGNTADRSGGGLYMAGDGNHTISNNTISNNIADLYGGGLVLQGGGVYEVSGNLVSENTGNYGGGIYSELNYSAQTNKLISLNVIQGNNAIEGGGIYSLKGGLVITNNDISGNSADNGGGIFMYSEDSMISNNRICNNTAINGNGGGLYIISSSNVELTQNIFENNGASLNGGAVWVSATSLIRNEHGDPLPDPDTFNSYVLNSPDAVYYE